VSLFLLSPLVAAFVALLKMSLPLPQLAPAPDMIDIPEAWRRLPCFGPELVKYWYLMDRHNAAELTRLRQLLSSMFYLLSRKKEIPDDAQELMQQVMLSLSSCVVCQGPAILNHTDATIFPCHRHAGHRACLAAPGTTKPLECPRCSIQVNMELPQSITNPETVLQLLEMRMINRLLTCASDPEMQIRLLQQMRADIASVDMGDIPCNTLIYYLKVELVAPDAIPNAAVAQQRASESAKVLGARNTETAIAGLRKLGPMLLQSQQQAFVPPSTPPVGSSNSNTPAQAAASPRPTSYATSPAISNSDQPLPQEMPAFRTHWTDPDNNRRMVMVTRYGGRPCGNNGCQVMLEANRTLIVGNPNGQKGFVCARCASNMTSVQLYTACMGNPPPGLSVTETLSVAGVDTSPPSTTDSVASMANEYGFGVFPKFAKFCDKRTATAASAVCDDEDVGAPPPPKVHQAPIAFNARLKKK
jgi:hypothetical protein